MKYGIKLKNGQWLYMLSEYEGNHRKPYMFESVGDAEVYAQNHELSNYLIEAIREEKQGSQLLNG